MPVTLKLYQLFEISSSRILMPAEESIQMPRKLFEQVLLPRVLLSEPYTRMPYVLFVHLLLIMMLLSEKFCRKTP